MTQPSPLRILYVEDNALVREVTTELLMQDARQIVAAGSAEEALQAFNLQPFDMVITDVSLPAMSGLELARRILELRPQAPIIIASGYLLELPRDKWGDRVRAVLKPFDAPQIDALIAELCAAVGH